MEEDLLECGHMHLDNKDDRRKVMMIKNDTIIHPTPSETLLLRKEKLWRLILPDDYKNFIMEYNGGVPEQIEFECNGHSYAVIRFLCILENVKNNPNGWYDVEVVESQIGERLTDNMNLVGIEVLPIVELFGGDYVCLDYRNDKNNPCVCVWSHEESNVFKPVTCKIADTFSDFLMKLEK